MDEGFSEELHVMACGHCDCFSCPYTDCVLTDEDARNAKRAYQKAYYAAHGDELIAKQKAYNEAHKVEISTKRKAYVEAHKEEITKKKKAYRDAHREEIRKAGREYQARRRAAKRLEREQKDAV